MCDTKNAEPKKCLIVALSMDDFHCESRESSTMTVVKSKRNVSCVCLFVCEPRWLGNNCAERTKYAFTGRHESKLGDTKAIKTTDTALGHTNHIKWLAVNCPCCVLCPLSSFS